MPSKSYALLAGPRRDALLKATEELVIQSAQLTPSERASDRGILSAAEIVREYPDETRTLAELLTQNLCDTVEQLPDTSSPTALLETITSHSAFLSRCIQKTVVRCLQLIEAGGESQRTSTESCSTFLRTHVTSEQWEHEPLKQFQLDEQRPTRDEVYDRTIRLLSFAKLLVMKQAREVVRDPNGNLLRTILLALLRYPSEKASLLSQEVLLSLVPTSLENENDPISLAQLRLQTWDTIETLLTKPESDASAGIAYKIWFKLVDGAQHDISDIAKEKTYWTLLQDGLRSGSFGHRKLCLAILEQSLLTLSEDISTPCFQFRIAEADSFRGYYSRYITLFQTIVLGRAVDRVDESLKDLESLPFSPVHQSWVTILLLAAFRADATQGAIRKRLGLWYMAHTEKGSQGSLDHINILPGFLEWASGGIQFTSSLQRDKSVATCRHGEQLANCISQVFRSSPPESRSSLFNPILDFLESRHAGLFLYTYVYILQGLRKGLLREQCLEEIQLENLLAFHSTMLLSPVARDASRTHLRGIVTALVPSTDTEVHQRFIDQINSLDKSSQIIQSSDGDGSGKDAVSAIDSSGLDTLQALYERIIESHYRCLNGSGLETFIDRTKELLDHSMQYAHASSSLKDNSTTDSAIRYEGADGSAKRSLKHGTSSSYDILPGLLEALWEQAEIQEFPRTVLLKLPDLYLHPECLARCTFGDQSLTIIVTRAAKELYKLSKTKIYCFPVFARAVRDACIGNNDASGMLDVFDIMISFSEKPPLPRVEFILEAATASMVQDTNPEITYERYYGKAEGYGYACVLDLLDRLCSVDKALAQSVLSSLLHPWINQSQPVSIVSKWKNTVQLQMMVIIVNNIAPKLSTSECTDYMEQFFKLLSDEPLPRYRYLLELVISRLCYHKPELTSSLIERISSSETTNPRFIQSLMRIALNIIREPDCVENFAFDHMVRLVPLCASSKQALRHEAHWSIPILWDHATNMCWTSITTNPAFAALTDMIKRTDKYTEVPLSRQFEAYNPVEDFTLSYLCMGGYLRVDPPGFSLVSNTDFLSVWEDDKNKGVQLPPLSIPLGTPKPLPAAATTKSTTADSIAIDTTIPSPAPGPLQTKGIAAQSILPQLLSSETRRRPASIIVIGSLLDNDYNLGGLSRCSEVFGCSTLTVPSDPSKLVQNKDFLNVAVSSHNHIPLEHVKFDGVVDYVRRKKVEGWTIVGVEQTDRSVILGEGKGGQLPEKMVVVMGRERDGIPAAVLVECDICVEIGTVGVTRSMNVQTATSVVLYEWWRERGQGKIEAERSV